MGATQRQLKARGIDSELITSAQGEETKLFVKQNSLAVKVEVNHVFRGTILPVTTMRLNQKARGAFPVSSEKENEMDRRMAALGVREVDIDETFVKSGGHGGQNVNKLATCVMLVHRPTGLQVKCQSTRHQGLNRFMARRLLLDKIEELRTGRVAAKQARIEKIKRQKRKRSRRAKEKMLADKALQSEKKAARRAGDS